MLAPDIADVLDRDREPVVDRPVSPTDISQFIRLDQCQRYLRLQLHSRQHQMAFMEAYDVNPQAIPPILTRSGAQFEDHVEAGIGQVFATTRFDDSMRDHPRSPDNAAIVELARSLAPGSVHVAFQPRMRANLGGWRITGVFDILHMERDSAGELHLMIADIKSSTAARVEHRLQVALYHDMLASILTDNGVDYSSLELGVLYRGPAEGTVTPDDQDDAEVAAQREQARSLFGISDGFLEVIDDPDSYTAAVHDLLTGPESMARTVLMKDFDAIPFHLTYKCDGCVFNEFCMKRSAETDNLSLLPFLTQQDKSALERAGIRTVEEVASLKHLVRKSESTSGEDELVPNPEREAVARELATTWPVGDHLDEIIHRAQSLTSWRKRDHRNQLGYLPNKGFSSLPYSGPDQNPNMIRVYIDAQHDYLHDRIYLLGALVVACESGIETPERRRVVVRMTDSPPSDHAIEERLFVEWIAETIRAVVEAAAPDENGEPRAPIHLVFADRFAQQQLLTGLGRHVDRIFGATALYDFITQIAGFNSPIASFLGEEVRKYKNYPMVCQSLQSIAAYERFDWNAPQPFRELFKTRQFDFWGRFTAEDMAGELPGQNGWFTNRSRFNSQIPLEYTYMAWGDVDHEATDGALDDYSAATPELVQAFHARRLDAMEHIAKRFNGNRYTTQETYSLPDLALFEDRARTLAHALQEFVFIERHVEVAAWKQGRLPAPELRVLQGDGLVLRFEEADQTPETLEWNEDVVRKIALHHQYEREYMDAHPDAEKPKLTKEQKAETKYTMDGMPVRMRVDASGTAADLDELLRLTTLRKGARLILMPRWTVDSRLPERERTEFAPTFRQIQLGMRATLDRFEITRDDEGRAAGALVDLTLRPSFGGNMGGFAFGTIRQEALVRGQHYTLDPDINNYIGYWQIKTIEAIAGGGHNTVYRQLTRQPAGKDLRWSGANRAAQQRFLGGLDALRDAGAMHDFEASKREFIAGHGDSPLLLVQGPPGTGKSYSTAFALLARIQGAMADNQPFRVFLSCKTHAATNVLLDNVLDAQAMLRELFRLRPEIMREFFDPRLLEVPLYRLDPREAMREGIAGLSKDDAKQVVELITGTPWLVMAGTPGAIYSLVKNRWSNKDLCGHVLAECLVLDEASQMNIPEALMASLPLAPDGRVIVVGDHRQMPPIVKHDWANEPRRSFREYRTYESLFLALQAVEPPIIRFEESFRLHAEIAEFLRREIYVKDGIHYHSNQQKVLPPTDHPDPFIRAALSPEHPLVVIVHDEQTSQQSNAFERELMRPILETLASPEHLGLDPVEGLGVVVPHRAQRAELQDTIRVLSHIDEMTGEITLSAVDTVERFQGGERTAILIGATESDREYILLAGDFLLDPRRLNVALSRAKRKMILVASRTIFQVFSADEATFGHAQIWKNLLRRTCTVPLWEGDRDGHHVEVWGNLPSQVRHE